MTDAVPHDPVEVRALLFEAMAAQIRLNKDAVFGGAFLLMPPGDAEPARSLMLNQDQPSIFWAAIKTLTELALNSMEQANNRFGR